MIVFNSMQASQTLLTVITSVLSVIMRSFLVVVGRNPKSLANTQANNSVAIRASWLSSLLATEHRLGDSIVGVNQLAMVDPK